MLMADPHLPCVVSKRKVNTISLDKSCSVVVCKLLAGSRVQGSQVPFLTCLPLCCPGSGEGQGEHHQPGQIPPGAYVQAPGWF